MLKNTTSKTIDVSKLWDKSIIKPKKNNCIFLLNNYENPIQKHFINIAYTEKIIDFYGCFYRISKRQLQVMEVLIKKQLFPEKINLILSDSIPQMLKGTYSYLVDNNNFIVNYINTHAKFCCIKTENNFYFIISSGNSNPDKKIEQLSIFNNKDIYDNYKSFCIDIQNGLKI